MVFTLQLTSSDSTFEYSLPQVFAQEAQNRSCKIRWLSKNQALKQQK